MTDRQTNGQTEIPLIDSTPERGRVKTHMCAFDQTLQNVCIVWKKTHMCGFYHTRGMCGFYHTRG